MRRTASSYRRRAPTREPYDYVLIVCEGTKTEPGYLRGLCSTYRLSSANIQIARAGATDPLSLVQFTERRLLEGNYDRAFCVFDRDGHPSYDDALELVRGSESGRAGRLRTIVSVPCFEVWVLLHFSFTSAPYTAVGAQSSCDRVLHALRRHAPDYEKGKEIYPELAGLMDTALQNAACLRGHNEATGSDNPSTQVDELIEYLRGLAAG